MKILVINAGSSSMKYQLVDMDTEQFIAKGNCERIGIDGLISYKNASGLKVENKISLPDHIAAFEAVMNLLTTGETKVIGDASEVAAIGHRFAHGGNIFPDPVALTEENIQKIETLSSLAPLHIPPAINAVRAAQKVFGTDKPMVAVFDTSFHGTIPEHAYRYGIPWDYCEKYGIRKYGFHGTSHRFVSNRLNELMGRNNMKVVTCHLGNGSSITAIVNGKSVDHSLGLSANGGLIMGTRCGEIDLETAGTIMEKTGKSAKEVKDILYKESGLQGVSGVSSDMRDLHAAAEQGNKRAEMAVKMLCYQIKKFIGSYAAAMGGLDAIVFTGGIGENDDIVREEACKNLEFLGIELDPEKNTGCREERCISATSSHVKVWVIPTNEEVMIAKDTKQVIFG